MTIDTNAIIACATAIAGAVGGHLNGKRVGVSSAVTVAKETVDMLALQVDLLVKEGTKKDSAIEQLNHRVDTLQELVTQRAAVEEVQKTVDRIADKLGA